MKKTNKGGPPTVSGSVATAKAFKIMELKGKAMYEKLLKRLMRSQRDTTVTLRIPTWLRDQIHLEAAKEGATMSNLLTDWALMGLSLSKADAETLTKL